MNENQIAQAFLDLFDDKIEESSELSAEDRKEIGAVFTTQENLEESLLALRERARAYKKNVDDSDARQKQWAETKKMWSSRLNQMLAILGETMERLHIPVKQLKGAGGTKLSSSSRTSYECDEEGLVQQFQQLADALQQQLPPYVKVKLTIDKTLLGAHLKQDNSLLINHPELVHTKSTTSITLK